MTKLLQVFIGVVVGLVIGLPVVALSFAYDVFATGFLLHKLWAWFVVGTFHVAALPIVAAAGISMMIHYITMQVRGPEDKCGVKPEVSAKEGFKHLGLILARPWLALLFGFVLHLFL